MHYKSCIKKNLMATALLLFVSVQAMAGTWGESLHLKARAAWSIGATAPIGLPETIRSIDGYKLTPSFLIGADVQMMLSGKWGVAAGLHFENKAMNGDVTTKAYRMDVRKGDSELDGLFTGSIHQKVTQWMFTLPVQATYTFNDRLQLKAGPYFSLLTAKSFDGIASDGYLRQGDPTGPKILMGTKEGEWATYDFSDDMRRFHVGVAVGLDWRFYRSLGLSVDLSWGLNGIFKSDFKTVEQTLFPVYGTVGVFYSIF